MSLVLVLPPAAAATTFTVTRNDDPAPDGCAVNGCSLREAVTAANAADGNDVTVPASAMPYAVTIGVITASKTMTINGGGAVATTITGDTDNNILSLNTASKTLTVNGVRLTGGHAVTAGQDGGAVVVNNGAVVLNGVVVEGNVVNVTSGNARGGGIAIESTGSATLLNTTVAGNGATTTGGGGIAFGGGILANGPLTLINSMVSENNVAGVLQAKGGGLYTNTGTTIVNSTFSANAVAGGNQRRGGGLMAENAPAVVTLTNATLTGNNNGVGGVGSGANIDSENNAQVKLSGTIINGGGTAFGTENCVAVNGGTVTSLGGNVDSQNQCGLGPGELRNTDPRLRPRSNNGGPTQTHALLGGSPARDAAGACGLMTDQRGFPRSGLCDAGAYEDQPPVARASASPSAAQPGQAVNFDGSTSTDPDPSDALSFAWSFDDGATSAGAKVAHAFANPGTHTATLTVTDPAGLASSASATVTVKDTISPTLSSLSFDRSSFPAYSSGPSAGAAKKKKRTLGAKVSYRLSESATVTWTVERRVTGRRSGKLCVALKRSNRKHKHCIRYSVVKGSFTTKGSAGKNKFRFTGRLRGKRLALGSYRLVGRARDAAGNLSAFVRHSFRIVS